MACKDIVVTISNYNPADTYTITIRLIRSKYVESAVPYTKVATGAQTLFTSLPDGEYVACVQRTCAAGGTSKQVCRDVVASECGLPANFVVTASTATEADLDWTADSTVKFELNKDALGWINAPGNHADISGLVAGHVYEYWLRKRCKIYDIGLYATVQFATTVVSPTFTVRVIEKVCNGTEFVGYRIRFNITGGIAPTADVYKIEFTDFYGDVHVFSETPVVISETMESLVRKIAANFDVIKMIIDPAGNFAAFDIISKEQKLSSGLVPNCSDINTTTGYTVSIV